MLTPDSNRIDRLKERKELLEREIDGAINGAVLILSEEFGVDAEVDVSAVDCTTFDGAGPQVRYVVKVTVKC